VASGPHPQQEAQDQGHPVSGIRIFKEFRTPQPFGQLSPIEMDQEVHEQGHELKDLF
jgi:hypothetical protein